MGQLVNREGGHACCSELMRTHVILNRQLQTPALQNICTIQKTLNAEQKKISPKIFINTNMSRSKATRRLLKYVGRTSSWKNNTIKYHDWGTREIQVVKENFVWFFVGGVRGGVILRENLVTRVWVCFFVCSPVVFCNCWLILVVVCYFGACS